MSSLVFPEPKYPVDDWTIPPGKKTGCLLRKSRPGQWCPMAKEVIELVPRDQWDSLAAQSQGLQPFVRKIKDQNGIGSCATESSNLAVEICDVFGGKPWIEYNPWYMYHWTSGGVDQGSSIDENLVFARDRGVCPEAIWPRSKGWEAPPSEAARVEAKKHCILEFYDVSNIDEMVSALLKGYSVVYGANGHSVLKIRHLNFQQGLDANSWGADWGSQGFGVWATYSRINWGYGAWAIRVSAEY